MFSKGTPSPKSPSCVLPPVPMDSNSPKRTLTPNVSPPLLPQSTNPTQTNEEPVVQSSPAVCVRQSSRPRRPVKRLDL